MTAKHMLRIALLFLASVGCETPRTEVLVRVHGDLAVQQRLASLTITVWSERGGRWRERLDGAHASRSELTWPVALGVVRRSKAEQRFEVVVSAFDAQGKVLVSDRALVRFRSDSTRELRLDLRSQCMQRAGCGDPSCHGPECTVCRASEDGAACVRVMERATGRYTKASYEPTAKAPADPDAGAPHQLPMVGGSCATEAARLCAAPGSRERLVCSEGVWQSTAACAADEVCDGREGGTLGTCLTRCQAGTLEGSYCLDESTLERCSPDGALLDRQRCRAGLHCLAKDGAASCADVDECANEPGLCQPGECINTQGGYTCSCPPGYAGERSCGETDVSCLWACTPGICMQERAGGPEICLCAPGFAWDGTACVDIDECASDTICASTCTNTVGSYACACGSAACDHHNRCLVGESGALCAGELADWPMPDNGPGAVHQASYAANADGTIADLVTGLVFQADVQEGAWLAAIARCENLTFAGRDDWRLPSFIELVSIVDYTHTGPASDVRFLGTATRRELTRDRLLTGEAPPDIAVRTISFLYGEATVNASTDVLPFRCVRGPAVNGRVRSARYELIGGAAELLGDRTTGLLWVRSPYGEHPFSEAETYCSSLVVAGYQGFRLATIKELHTLADPTEEYGRSAYILGDPSSSFTWSSSQFKPSQHWLMDWSGRSVAAVSDRVDSDALCVRELD